MTRRILQLGFIFLMVVGLVSCGSGGEGGGNGGGVSGGDSGGSVESLERLH